MARRPPHGLVAALSTHRRKLLEVVSGKASARLKRLYGTAQEQVVSRIRRLVARGRSDTFTAQQQRVVLAQLRQGQAIMANALAANLRPLSREAQEASLSGLVEEVARLSKAFTGSEVVLPVAEAATFAGVVEQREASLLRIHKASMARYGAAVVEKVEDKLAVALLTGTTPQEAVEAVAETVDGEWYQGERIVRTEMAHAYNLAHKDGMEASAEELPTLRQRWEEHCDDSGRPLDDRVGVDSIAMHSQVAPVGGLFTMPSEAPFPDAHGRTQVPKQLAGLSWAAPPCRPNDRAVLAPWMEGWEIPGWEWREGRRLWLKR